MNNTNALKVLKDVEKYFNKLDSGEGVTANDGVLTLDILKSAIRDMETSVKKLAVFEAGGHYHNCVNDKYLSVICEYDSLAFGKVLIAESSGSIQFQYVLPDDYIAEDWEEVSKGECQDAIQRKWAIGGR